MTTDLRPAAPDRGDPIESAVPNRTPYLLTWLLAATAACATVPTLLVDGLLRGEPAMNGSARGTALVMLVVAVPVLLVAAESVRRGSLRAVPIWLGAVGYLAYNAFMLSFATPFNAAFLIYVALFPLCFWTMATALSSLDVGEFAASITPGLWRRTMATVVGTIAVLNALAWLKNIVPALGSDQPAFLDGTGLLTSPTFVQDLGFWLPLTFVSAIWLWQRRRWGHLLATALLTMLVIEAVGVAVDQWFGATADPESPVVSMAAVPMFAAIALVCVVPLWHLIAHIPTAREL